MKGVAELVECGLDIVDAEIFGEVADVHDNRAHLVSVFVNILVANIVHPGSTPLAVARERVGGEDADQRTVRIGNLVSLYARVVNRHVLKRLSLDTVEPVGCEEDALHHIVNVEVRLGEFLVEIILGLAHALGVVPPVPRLDLRALRKEACLDVLVHNLLHIGEFLACLLNGGSHNVREELVNGLVVVGHLAAENLVGRIAVTQDVCLLDAEVHNLEDELAVVILVSVVAAAGVGLVVLARNLMVPSRIR